MTALFYFRVVCKCCAGSCTRLKKLKRLNLKTLFSNFVNGPKHNSELKKLNRMRFVIVRFSWEISIFFYFVSYRSLEKSGKIWFDAYYSLRHDLWGQRSQSLRSQITREISCNKWNVCGRLLWLFIITKTAADKFQINKGYKSDWSLVFTDVR